MDRKVVKCPICEKELQDRGLKGHLRFKHQITGQRLEQECSGVFEREERHSLMERIVKLHDRLREVRRKIEEVEREDKGGFFVSDEAIEKLRKLYKWEEKDIQRQIDLLMRETDIEEDEDEWGLL